MAFVLWFFVWLGEYFWDTCALELQWASLSCVGFKKKGFYTFALGLPRVSPFVRWLGGFCFCFLFSCFALPVRVDIHMCMVHVEWEGVFNWERLNPPIMYSIHFWRLTHVFCVDVGV